MRLTWAKEGTVFLLEVNNLSVFYEKAEIFHDVNLRVDKGEIVAIIGPNGTGKTTLLRTISGLHRAAKGSITFSGERIDGLPPHEIVKRGIAHCPERYKLFPDMTVLENIEMGAFLRKNHSEIQIDLEEAFSLFPLLEERKRQQARILSGGEQQMLAVARGLMSKPKLLMLDEPSLGLAPIIRNKRGITIMMIEQDVALALGICDRGYVFEEGTVIMEGSKKFLEGNPRIREAYLGII